MKGLNFLCIDQRNLTTLVYTKLVHLNIFSLRDFEINTDRMTTQRLGQWATRLYIVLLAIGLVILTLYTIVQPQTLTKTFDRPPLNVYNHLKQEYGDALKCSCSSIASTFNQFVNIEPEFHEVRRDYSNLPRIKNEAKTILLTEYKYCFY